MCQGMGKEGKLLPVVPETVFVLQVQQGNGARESKEATKRRGVGTLQLDHRGDNEIFTMQGVQGTGSQGIGREKVWH